MVGNSRLEMYHHWAQFITRRVWRYQRSNQYPYIEEEQTTQWSKEKVEKDKQRSTKHTYTTKDRVTRTPLKIGDELGCSGRVSSSFSTSDTRRVKLISIRNCCKLYWIITYTRHPFFPINHKLLMIYPAQFID
jgi:hypothetical protein